ncbi:MAG: hypothetical protein ACI4OT_02865 [Bacilli bacterium]
MTKKEKKELLNDLDKARNELENLNRNIREKYEDLDWLKKEEEVLNKKIQQCKMYIDLKTAIETLQEEKNNLEQECNNYFDRDKLVFAEYSLKDDDKYNLGVFKVSISEEPIGYDYKPVNLYRNIFNPLLVGAIYSGKGRLLRCDDEPMSIYDLRNIVSFSDVLVYTNNQELLLKEKVSSTEIMKVMETLIENSELFGLSGYEDRVKLLQKTRGVHNE